MAELVCELFVEQRGALIHEAAAEAASEARIMAELVCELFVEQREALIVEAASDAYADEAALARVMRDPGALDAALLARASSLPDAAVAQLLRTERISAAAELRVLDAARAGTLSLDLARSLAETRRVSDAVLRVLRAHAAAGILPPALTAELAAAPQVAAAGEARIVSEARGGALGAGAAAAIAAALLPRLAHLTALDDSDLECCFCLSPVDLEDPGARYMVCCPGARFACGGCAAHQRDGDHHRLGHQFEAEATPVRLAADLRRRVA